MYKQLPVPPFFNPKGIDKVWPVPYHERQAQALEWAKRYGVKHASTDSLKVALLIIDAQNTFCTPGYELVVGGAIDDNKRLCELLYRNLPVFTSIFPTLDTHTAMQIFHTIFLVDSSGNPAPPMTQVSEADVASGKWRLNPNIAWSLAEGDETALKRYLRYYVKALKTQGKYDLTVWPYHAMLGSSGHALVSAIEEAIFFHTIARSSQAGFRIKGGNGLTENYSVLNPEVLVGPDGDPIAQRNTEFFSTLINYDRIVIAGQAKSHCVAWTIDDLLNEIAAKDPKLAKKVYLLEDCTSPVIVPGFVDFTKAGDEAFAKFAAAGMHVVRSTDPMDKWSDFGL